MMPTSDETGAQPIAVLTGAEREGGLSVDARQRVVRARAYAARAIDRVFNRPEFTVPRPSIARMVGANKPSWDAFFGSLDGRPLSWWNEAVFKRVVDAVMECEPGGNDAFVKPDEPSVNPDPDSDNQTAEKVNSPVDEPPPYKAGPLPPARSPMRQPPEEGYRPPSDTIRKVLEDDAEDDSPVFDRGDLGGAKPRTAPVVKSKRQMNEDLAEAVRNTAAQTPPEE